MIAGRVEYVLLSNTNGKLMFGIISNQNTFLGLSHISAHFVGRRVVLDKAWKIIKESTRNHNKYKSYNQTIT